MKTKLVVINENTLAYIPPMSNVASVLRASTLKGSRFNDFSQIHFNDESYRLATEKDFNEYNVVFNGYKKDNNNYEWEIV